MKTKIMQICLAIMVTLQYTACTTHQEPTLAKIEPMEDEYCGKKITDPYRYMENLQDPYVESWFKSQADYSRSVLNSIPGRQSLIHKMREFDERKSTRVGNLRITDNDQYFYIKTTPEDETGKLFYRDGYEGEEIFLYDPQTFSPDTTQKYVITDLSPSDDGSKVAFELVPNGSEVSILLTMDVKSKTLYPEKIDRCLGASPSWLPSGDAFLFRRLRSSNVHDKDYVKDSKTYLHTIGTDPGNDREIFSRKKYPELGIKPENFPMAVYNNDSHCLLGSIPTVGGRLNVFYAPASDIDKEKISWKHLIKPEDEIYDYWATETELYVMTSKDAPNFKILKTSLQNPDLANAEVIVPENPREILTSFRLTNEGVYFTLSTNGVEAKLYRLPYQTKIPIELDLPFAAGSISLMTKGFKFSDVWVVLSGWTSDYQRFRYSVPGNEFKLENPSATAEYPEYADLKVEELMVPSHDGLKVPLSLIYKKGIKKDGKNPVFIIGYGAYGYSMTPAFSPNRWLLWVHEGGILACAHVRGGGELGEQWYKAGFKTTKPNTWKDLISCTEYLIQEQYSSPSKIAINSRSAGGILIGRAMTERPDLFAVAIPEVGCLNPLRLEESPVGVANVPEFGPVKDPVECTALIEMDAYLHLKDGVKYPATLVTAGMNDPRVNARLDPAKFAARLQAANASDKPILFWADYEGGHGIGDTKTKQYESTADVLSFALWQTGHPKYQIR